MLINEYSMIVTIAKPVLEMLYYRRAALCLSSYQCHYEELKRKQWNYAIREPSI